MSQIAIKYFVLQPYLSQETEVRISFGSRSLFDSGYAGSPSSLI